jgi:membrane fusion protein, multidrug efflux system
MWMPKSRLLLLVVAVSVVMGAVVVVMLREEPPASSSPPGQGSDQAETNTQAASLASVQVLRPQRRDLAETLTLPANVSPWLQATLYAKVPGYLKWMGADKGDTVKKGQLLAVIDAPEIEQQYQQADADYQIKKVTFERLRNVWTDNPDVIAKQDVDLAEAAAKGAKYLRDSRRTFLEYTKVIAPFDGIITARFADPGALIQSAAGSATQAAPLFTLMDLNTVRVYVSVPQEAALHAKDGVPATLSARELPGLELRGAITRTTKALDPATRTLLVEIDLPNSDHRLRPGMFVTAKLILKEHPHVLALPPAALVSGKSEKTVFIVEGGKAREVPVKTGLDDGVWVEITDGLEESMDVVVVGKSGLTDGQAVQTSSYNLPAGQPASQKL